MVVCNYGRTVIDLVRFILGPLFLSFAAARSVAREWRVQTA